MRFDSGFWSKDLLSALERLGVSYTMAVRANTKAIAQVTATIAEEDWVAIAYPEGGEAAVAETTYKGRRLVVRRTRLLGPEATLWPDWRHFAFLTDLTASAVEVDAFHRERAQAELDIRDLKEGAGMKHCPSGSFAATRPGSAAPSWLTTWCAGPRSWAVSTTTTTTVRPRSDHPHSLRLAARSARQPLGNPDVARTEPLAMAGAFYPGPFEPACPCGRRHLKRHPAVGAAAEDPHQCADNPPTTRASGRRRSCSGRAGVSAARTSAAKPLAIGRWSDGATRWIES